MIKGTGQSLATKGLLEEAVGLATAGVLVTIPISTTGCTIVPRTLMTKGVIPCPTADSARALMTKGILCCPVAVIEPVDEIVVVPGYGSSRTTRKPQERAEPQKKVKVTVCLSGETFTQELIVNPKLSVEAQVLEVMELPENTIFVTAKRLLK